MSTIMVQITDRPQTLAALHFACPLARSQKHSIVLLQLVPVTHPGWLGTEWGDMNYTEADRRATAEYEKIAQSYGVEVQTQPMQYVSLAEAIVQAAVYVNAQMVFARLPHSILPLWHNWQTRLLRWRLAQQQCQLYVLEYQGDVPNWIPANPVAATYQTVSRN